MSKTTRRKLTFNANDEITILFKENPDHQVFTDICSKYGIELKLNAVGILVAKGDKDKTLELEHRFKHLKKPPSSFEDLKQVLEDAVAEETKEDLHNLELEFKDRTGRISHIKPKNEHQREFMNHIIDNKVTIGMGSAGTGKTFLAVAMALKMLEARKVSKIVISRPAVEAGKSIGFLPGSAEEKMEKYVAPILSILEEIIGFEKREKLIEDKKIEILPVGYARGLTLGGAKFGVVTIIDEAQNLEFIEHKLLLTRLGSHPNSRIILCGDQRQSDLHNAKDTLTKIHSILKESPFVASTIFTKEDIVRSEAVKDILGRIEDYEDQQAASKGKK